MKYITDDGIKTAFLTMMNKLVFAHQSVLKPLLHSLQGFDDKDSFYRYRNMKLNWKRIWRKGRC